MVHYKETNVADGQHEGELAGAVRVDDAGDFVCKSSKAEDVGNGMVVNVVNEIEARADVGDVVILDGFDEARHDGVRD
jgi:hypothetical protein